MRPPRPVVYPPRRRSSVADALALAVGLVTLLVAGGIAVVALAAVFTITPHATDTRHGDVAAARVLVEATAAPMIRGVAVRPTLFGRQTLVVTLVRGARAAGAREAWCEVILPTGIGREFVEVHGGGGQWRAPADCTDPTSRPGFIAPYLD